MKFLIHNYIAIIECCDTWHRRIGHVNKNTIKMIMHLDMINKGDKACMCQTCEECFCHAWPLC